MEEQATDISTEKNLQSYSPCFNQEAAGDSPDGKNDMGIQDW